MPFCDKYAQYSISSELLYHCSVINNLTPAESTVIYAVARCIPLTKVASLKSVSYKTTSVQKRSAYRKMKVSSDVEFIHYLYSLKGGLYSLSGHSVLLPLHL
ncbi:TPA: hypothetical protein ON570_004108 [Citrobacter werkmanii]|nr:hypothetical protein [Citrobacter werkmanii]